MVQVRDLVIKNALVRTVDDRNSVHDAVLLSGGRIGAVGTEQQVLAAAGRDAEIFDANGRTVVPGFIDAHNHLSIAAFEPDAVDCSTPPFTTLDEVLGAIEAHCKTVPDGQWVRGVNFHMANISEMRNPNRYELDEVAPNNPFFLIDASCHAGVANSAAPAHASGRASEEGSIEIGKRANVLILDRDPITCATQDLRSMTVDRTYVDGQLAHERQPAPAPA